jgi:hypothetical protein
LAAAMRGRGLSARMYFTATSIYAYAVQLLFPIYVADGLDHQSDTIGLLRSALGPVNCNGP